MFHIAKAQGGGPDEILAMICGVCFLGAFIEIGLSQMLGQLRRIITPLVTGTVITIIGISLIKVGITDLAGGQWLKDNKSELWGSLSNLFLGITVMVSIIVLNQSRNPWVRLSSIVLGLVIGFILALFMGKVNTSQIFAVDHLVSIPVPFKYGFDFDFLAFLPVALIYLITAIESSGDITANCLISKQEISGSSYINRIKSGILGDGVNSAIATLFNTFPNTTFSQNNGVIQLTGIASRHVGVWIGIILIVMGLFPHLGSLLRAMPNAVLGGATIVMFGTVTVTGIKILSRVNMNRRNILILAISFGMGLGVLLIPELISTLADNIGGQFGKIIGTIFSSAITTGGLTVIILLAVMGDKAE